MRRPALAAAAGALALAAAAPAALAAAEGPATPQAVAANAEFLATWSPPPGHEIAAVCVIDSGVDTDTDLGPALVKRSAFDGGTPGDTGALGDDGTPLPKHGTYVAGVIASQIDGVGTNGIWPQARVLSRRVFVGVDVGTSAADYIRAIDWCLSDPIDDVKVINLSLSGLTASNEEKARLEDKILQVRTAPYGVNVVAAAGNNGRDAVGYPASAPGVFGVGAVGGGGLRAPFSNHGAGLDISALGVGTCLTTAGESRLATGQGTSYAAPVVSAVLAALRSGRPDLRADEAEALLLDTADVTPAGRVLDGAQAFVAAGLLADDEATKTHPDIPCVPPPVVGTSGGTAPSGGGAANVSAADDPRPTPEAPPTPATPPVPVPPPMSTSITDVRLPAVARPAQQRPGEPTLRRLTYRRGRLHIRVAGFRRGDRVIFRVSRRTAGGLRNRTYVRSRPVLAARVRRWRAATVRLRRPGSGTSAALEVRRDRDF